MYICKLSQLHRQVYRRQNFDGLLQTPASTFAIRKVRLWMNFYFGDTGDRCVLCDEHRSNKPQSFSVDINRNQSY